MEQLKEALKKLPPDCAGIAANYQCGNHDAVPQYSGPIISVSAGDELAMNSMVVSVVEIDGEGNGTGLIKIPMMNKLKFGLKLEGIKVAKGGCIVAGKAALSGVSVDILTAKQKEMLKKAYAVFNEVIDLAIENADLIAKTYNSFVDLADDLKDKATKLSQKLRSGGQASPSEVANIKGLAEQTNAQMEASLAAIRKQMGNQINQETAARLEGMIAQNKANVAALSASVEVGKATPAAVAAAASSLAALQPAQIEKDIKTLMPLAVEYSKLVYQNNKQLNIPTKDETPTFTLRNAMAGEPISWTIKDGNATLFTPTANPVSFIWPKDKLKLTLEAVQGNRKMSITLQKKTFAFTDLVAIDHNARNRKAFGSKNETLYIVRTPATSRTIEYNMITTAKRADFVDSDPVWNTTLPKNGGVYEGMVLNGINSPIAETRHTSSAAGTTTAKAFGYDGNVKVEVVDENRERMAFSIGSETYGEKIKEFYEWTKGADALAAKVDKIPFLKMGRKGLPKSENKLSWYWNVTPFEQVQFNAEGKVSDKEKLILYNRTREYGGGFEAGLQGTAEWKVADLADYYRFLPVPISWKNKISEYVEAKIMVVGKADAGGEIKAKAIDKKWVGTTTWVKGNPVIDPAVVRLKAEFGAEAKVNILQNSVLFSAGAYATGKVLSEIFTLGYIFNYRLNKYQFVTDVFIDGAYFDLKAGGFLTITGFKYETDPIYKRVKLF